MTTVHVFIATSLDGFIARPDGDVDWLMKYVVEGEDNGYETMVRFHVGDDTMEGGPGSLIRIPPGVEHYAEPISNERFKFGGASK